MMKSDTVMRQVKRIEDNLDRLENGRYADMSISQINSKIDWLYKYRHIDRETMERLVDRAMCVMGVEE